MGGSLSKSQWVGWWVEKKLSEPEKMLVWYEDAFERERVCFEHEDDAYVRAKNLARNGHWNYF
jgi:hypothetical protein